MQERPSASTDLMACGTVFAAMLHCFEAQAGSAHMRVPRPFFWRELREPMLLEFHHRSSLMPLKNGCRTFPSADFARYSISASNDGSTQVPRCEIFLA